MRGKYDPRRGKRRGIDPADVFYMGQPCLHGHDGLRYRKGNQCVRCTREHTAKRDREVKAGIASFTPAKPRNPVPGDGWPFGYVDEQGVHHGKTFRDHPNPVAGKYVKNLRHLPLRVGTWGVSA